VRRSTPSRRTGGPRIDTPIGPDPDGLTDASQVYPTRRKSGCRSARSAPTIHNVSRTVALLLTDGDGVPLGTLPPFPAALPYWQKMTDVVPAAVESAPEAA
jgi:hypothetical protein